MKKCCEDCIPVCDFCIYFEHFRDEEGLLTGEGKCKKYDKVQSLSYYCKDFTCFNTVKKNQISTRNIETNP